MRALKVNIIQNVKQKFKSRKSKNKQICGIFVPKIKLKYLICQTRTFFGLEICIYHFCLLIAQPHHVRFKVMECKHKRWNISGHDSNGRQMVEGTKQIWGTVKNYLERLENSLFCISFFYLLLYVLYMQYFTKKIHVGGCYWCKIGMAHLVQQGAFYENFIVLLLSNVMALFHPISNFKSWSRSLEDMKKQLYKGAV